MRWQRPRCHVPLPMSWAAGLAMHWSWDDVRGDIHLHESSQKADHVIAVHLRQPHNQVESQLSQQGTRAALSNRG